MGDSSGNPALQLFHLELQELMEQVGLALTALMESASAAEFKRLCRAVRLIHQGAVQMNLQKIEQRTSEFLKILLPVSNVPEGDLSSAQLEQLMQLFQALQTVEIMPSVSSLELVDTQKASISVAPDVSNDQNGHLNATNFTGSVELDTVLPNVARGMRRVLLEHDIAEVIRQLEHSLTHLAGEALAADVVAKADVLAGWGEVLDWQELGALARAIAQGVKTHAGATPSIALVGLTGLQALHRLALQDDKTSASAEQDIASPTENHAVAVPFVFKTAQRFIWQSQRAIFVLDSSVIAETLIPQQAQIISFEQQRQLRWQGQRVLLFNPTQLLVQQWTPVLGTKPVIEPEVATSQGPVVVISTARGMMALEIEMEQFIRTPEIGVTPVSPSPRFFLGHASDHASLPLIDLLELLMSSSQVTDPVLDAQFSPAVLPEDSGDRQVSGAVASASPSTSVLIVDDSRIIRYLLQRTFEGSPFSVILAHDGLDAIQKLQQHPEITLVISDVEMPNLNGFEFVSRCRRYPKWRDLPIIIVSQCSTDQHQQLALQFGANAYLPKPFDDETLLSTVESVLAQK